MSIVCNGGRTRGSAPLLMILCTISALAADRTVPPIVEAARAAPPEFFADSVIRLIRGGKIPQRELQIALLDEAFSVLRGAKEPIRLIGVPGIPPDTREIYRSKAAELRFDALSIESRIIREMVTLDRARARSLFDGIARPKLEPRGCGDPFIADASPYYEAAAAIGQSAFSDREKNSELHVQFLSAVLAGAQSPNELAGYAKSLQSVTLSASEWRLLVAGLIAKLESMPPDYRSFATSIDALQNEIGFLANFGGADELKRAFRKYLVNQMRAARCAPDLALGLDQIAWLEPPLTEDESKPANRKESYSIALSYFQSDMSSQIGDKLTMLRSAQDGRRNLLLDILRDFAAWRPEGSTIDVFHQKATVLRALMEMTPRGEDRDRLCKQVVTFLESSAAEREAPAEWLWEARALFDVAGADAAKLAAAFRASSSVSLSLYATLGYFGDSSGTSK